MKWDHMLGWEYMTIDMYAEDEGRWELLGRRLNELGYAGWELVAVTGNDRAFFKRRVAKSS